MMLTEHITVVLVEQYLLKVLIRHQLGIYYPLLLLVQIQQHQ